MKDNSCPKIVVVIPTYNEKDNLESLTKAVCTLRVPGTLEMIIIDDNSPDGTGRLADDLAKTNPRIKVVHRQRKLGLGSAYITGFGHALSSGADIVIQMDADFSHEPSVIPDLINLVQSGADLAIGSRYVAGGRLDVEWGWARRLLSWWANRVWISAVLGLPVRDATAGFRAWSAPALERIGLAGIKANGYYFQIEMTFLAQEAKCTIVETPIYFRSRRQGQSKMDLRLQFEAAIGVLLLRWRRHSSR